MCNHVVAMEISREVTLDATADEVWSLLSDPDELAGWVGEEVRAARFLDAPEHSLRWSWSTGDVELELVEVAPERTVVRVTERSATAAARACAISDAWDDRLFGLEVRCLVRQPALARA